MSYSDGSGGEEASFAMFNLSPGGGWFRSDGYRLCEHWFPKISADQTEQLVGETRLGLNLQ